MTCPKFEAQPERKTGKTLAEETARIKREILAVFSEQMNAQPERKTGRWDNNCVTFYRKCSECGCCVEWNKKPFLFGNGEYNYCPSCGAKMEGQDDNS